MLRVQRSHCPSVATSSRGRGGGAARTLLHSLIFTAALQADDLCGLALSVLLDEVDWVASVSSSAVVSVYSSDLVVTLSFNGYSFATGRLVNQVAVRSVTARTLLSPPVIKASTTPIFDVVRGVSSCISTTSPVLTVWWVLPVALWTSLKEVRYLWCQRFWKLWSMVASSFALPQISP